MLAGAASAQAAPISPHVSSHAKPASTRARLHWLTMPVDAWQELQQPQLQQLSLGTKSAVAMLKYLPLNPSILPQVRLEAKICKAVTPPLLP